MIESDSLARQPGKEHPSFAGVHEALVKAAGLPDDDDATTIASILVSQKDRVKKGEEADVSTDRS